MPDGSLAGEDYDDRARVDWLAVAWRASGLAVGVLFVASPLLTALPAGFPLRG